MRRCASCTLNAATRCCWSRTAMACAGGWRTSRGGPGHVPPADGRAVHRRQRVPPDPRHATSSGHHRGRAVARGGRALKRFGVDTATPLAEPEATFLHRYYDYVVVPAEGTRAPYGAALRSSACSRLVPRGRTSSSDHEAMQAARERLLAAYPVLAGRRSRWCAPTFRGRARQVRGCGPRRGPGPAGRPAGRPCARPQDPS